MDPNKSTREEFTAGLVNTELPSDANPEWLDLAQKLRTLLDELAHHPAMAENLHQTYMTPAADKNRVYFMWDFVGRTLGYVYNTDPNLRNISKAKKDRWNDAQGRATFAAALITDKEAGMLNQMTEMTYPGQKGKHPEFGDKILEIANTL